jgi:hypothetical protein
MASVSVEILYGRATDLASDCTFKPVDRAVRNDYTSQRCYSECNPSRAINFQQTQLNSAIVTTDYSGECYCGLVLGNEAAPADSSHCRFPCNGHCTEMCGGTFYFNLHIGNDLVEA